MCSKIDTNLFHWYSRRLTRVARSSFAAELSGSLQVLDTMRKMRALFMELNIVPAAQPWIKLKTDAMDVMDKVISASTATAQEDSIIDVNIL